jgi:hypothetical protein
MRSVFPTNADAAVLSHILDIRQTQNPARNRPDLILDYTMYAEDDTIEIALVRLVGTLSLMAERGQLAELVCKHQWTHTENCEYCGMSANT